MTRAEEVALKTYPDKEVNGVSLVFSEQRRLFQEGYELAEQDLALTAEDVSCIIHLADQFGKDYQRIADVFNKDREEEDETQ
jgi:hypothetical protein